ncbi:KilA-N domain protein [Polaribacter phage Leef_1]|uniref:KilA-N domain protein n=1 Tax=Polaribacter phage Leef_1 TaxID=2745684 RepID=A0A8E4ZM40_9CAUD|nr:transcriptional regulator [Polaribacter phage Leef_1]QQV91384.1 KilA-N domain protein [Polaribacter phage Leef_1]
MKTKATQFIYQDTAIHFALSNNKNVMINATEMAKAFNKRIDVFLKTEPTKAFLNALEFPPVGVNSAPLKKEQIISTHGQNGTYFTRILALKFAAWLDVDFEIWVFSTIDEILFGDYLKHQNAIEETLKAEKELHVLEARLAEDPNFKRIQELQEFIKTKDSEKRKALAAKKLQIKLDLGGI